MGSIAMRREKSHREHLMECVTLKQKSLDLYQQMKNRLSGSGANEVRKCKKNWQAAGRSSENKAVQPCKRIPY
jgi:hypothetical protein